MAKTPTSPTTNTEWRSGRPSFKAFYPEIFLLTLITIAFIALGAKLSCNAIKKAKTGDAPAEVTTLSLFCAPVYGQEPALDGTESGETELVIDAAPEESTTAPEPVAQEDAVATEAPATPEPGPAATEASVAIDPEQTAPEAPAESKSLAPNAEQTTSGAAPAQEPPAAKGKIPWNKILWIWVCCLIVPVALWIWRGASWICAVYGVEYELRVDEENPRATTFLIKRGIFNKTTDSMHIGAVKDVKSLQSFWQKYFKGGVGTIWLYTSDKTDDKVEMKNMPEPSRVFNAFDTLRKHYWARGGMQLSGSAGSGEPLGDDGAFDHDMGGEQM